MRAARPPCRHRHRLGSRSCPMCKQVPGAPSAAVQADARGPRHLALCAFRWGAILTLRTGGSMDRADADSGAELPDLLRATEQRLLALSRRCHQLWLDSGRHALAEVTPHRLPQDTSVNAQSPRASQVANLVKDLAQQLEELSASLTWQAAVLGAGPVQRRDVGRET